MMKWGKTGNIFLLGVIVTTLLSISSIAQEPCHTLPDYVNMLDQYYSNVNVYDKSCYPSFTFLTPPEYSKNDIAYPVTYGDFLIGVNITTFDSNIRKRVSQAEECTDTSLYTEIHDGHEVSLLPLKTFLDEFNHYKTCANLTSAIKTLNKHELAKEFLKLQVNFSIHDTCRWSEFSKDNMYIATHDAGLRYNMSFLVLCGEDKPESMLLVVENDEVTEAYLQDPDPRLNTKINIGYAIPAETFPVKETTTTTTTLGKTLCEKLDGLKTNIFLFTLAFSIVFLPFLVASKKKPTKG